MSAPASERIRRLPRPITAAAPGALAVIFTVFMLAAYHVFLQPEHPYLIGLFPVIASAVLAGAGPAVLSLFITTYYIDMVITPAPNHAHIFAYMFFVEGMVV